MNGGTIEFKSQAQINADIMAKTNREHAALKQRVAEIRNGGRVRRNMLKANVVYFEDLTKDEQEIQPNNGWGKEYANYVKITDGSETVMILSDAIEPEDKTFNRDLRIVVYAIEKAYKIGLRDGKKLAQAGKEDE